MHWHAIKQSVDREQPKRSINHAHAINIAIVSTVRLDLDGNISTSKDHSATWPRQIPCSTGDDACDLKPALERVSTCGIPGLAKKSRDAVEDVADTSLGILSSEVLPDYLDQSGTFGLDSCSQASSSSKSRVSQLTEESLRSLNSSFSPARSVDERSQATVEDAYTSTTRTFLPFLQASIPSHAANNLAPFAYQRALRNRIRDDELSRGCKYDVKAYTPMFVHDCLMVPGSLASARRKGSVEDVVRRMTPALLPGFSTLAHATTHEPLILQSSKAGDHVNGMLVFGQSRKVRRNVHEHYRPFCKRIKVEVELDTVHAVPAHRQACPGERWELRRRSVWAHAWIWRNAHSADARLRSQGEDAGWRFDDYLAGKHQPAQSLRIEPAGWIEDDRETVVSGEAGESDASLTHWGSMENVQTTEWEEGSGAGAAVPFDDHAWDHFEGWSEGDEEDEYFVDRGAFDRDYDRSGSAGYW